jgi:ATP-dependent Clp protease adaptor protein ClpS
MSDVDRGREGTGLVVEEAAPKLKRPPLYQVVLINDDYTPMEFVVDILQRFFAMDRTKATRLCWRSIPREREYAGSLLTRSRRPRWLK